MWAGPGRRRAASTSTYWAGPTGGRGPAGPAVREAVRGRLDHAESAPAGPGRQRHRGYGVLQGYGYFDRLARNPAGEFAQMRGICLEAVLPNLRVRNLAQSGDRPRWTTCSGSATPCPAGRGDAALVVITSGGNDLIHNYGLTPPREVAMYGATLAQARPWIAAYQQRLRAMLDLLEERFPGGLHVFLADIYDPTDGEGDAPSAGLPAWPEGLQVLAAYNEVIRRHAAGPGICPRRVDARRFPGPRHPLRRVPLRRPHYRPADPHYWYGANLEDPNHRGYDAIRRLMLVEIAKVFRDRSQGSAEK